jgi:Pilus assembly protein, PilO
MKKPSVSGRLAALLAVAVTLVVVIAGWLVLVSPQRSKAAEVQGKVDAAQAQLQATQAYINDPANKQRQRELQRLEQILPDTIHMSQVLRQLNSASAATGVQIDSITPATPTPAAAGEAVPVSLSVEGHYFNLLKFFKALRARVQVNRGTIIGKGRLYSVSAVTFSAGGTANSGSSNVLTAAVQLQVYDFTTPPAAPTTTETTTTTGG